MAAYAANGKVASGNRRFSMSILMFGMRVDTPGDGLGDDGRHYYTPATISTSSMIRAQYLQGIGAYCYFRFSQPCCCGDTVLSHSVAKSEYDTRLNPGYLTNLNWNFMYFQHLNYGYASALKACFNRCFASENETPLGLRLLVT